MDELTIYKKLYKNFQPSFLQVKNESHLHRNHSQSPKNGNSHFFVEIRSDCFKNLNRLQQQRKIYNLLEEEMKTSIHALRISILD